MATIDLIVEIPVANPFKFIQDGANSDERANYDQRRYALVKNASVEPLGDFKLPVEKADPYRVQFYSNFPLNKVTIVDCDDNEFGAPMTPSVAVQYRNKKYRSACKFFSIDGKLFIYFVEGLEYSDEDFEVPGNLVALNGVTPNINALVGDVVRFSINDGVDFISTSIDEQRWIPELQAEGYLTDLDYTLLSPIDGLVEITYDEKPANLLSQLIDFSGLDDGEYFIRYSVGIAGYTISYTTEPIDVQESNPDTLALEYRHAGTYDKADIWSYIYPSDWFNKIRIPTDFYEFIPAGEVEVDTNDSGIPRMLRARPFRQLLINFINMPGWLADKIQVALSHDTKVVNEYEWELADNYGSFNLIDQLDQGTYEVALRQKNDRTKKIDAFTAEITAGFDPDSFANIVFDGDVVTAEFISNTLGVFRFISLPAWIETDVEEFSNGDIVEFTIAANATFFDRSIQLIAISDDFDNLHATIDFQQDHDEEVAEFLDVSSVDVVLDGNPGANQLLNVSSSGDYDITFSGAHTFTAAKESGFTQVRISEPTSNVTTSNKVGVVRLTLQSNPAIFVDINVTQTTIAAMYGLTPALESFGPSGGTIEVDVAALSTAQWQASTSDGWLTFDTSVQVGTVADFEVFVMGKGPFVPPRTGTVTFFNIFNPSDAVVLTIEQTD
jgi:hypothetical protein